MAAEHSALSGRMRCIEGDEEACRGLELAALERLVQAVEAAVPKLRQEELPAWEGIADTAGMTLSVAACPRPLLQRFLDRAAD